MSLYKYLTWLMAVALLMSLSACNIGVTAPPAAGTDTNVVPTQTVENGPTPTEAVTEVAATEPSTTSHACDNPYLPVIVGATWVYRLTGPIPDTFTHTFLSVESAGFTEQDQFDSGVTRQGQWQCDEGNLIALNPTGGNSASVSAEGVSVDFQTTELSGVTLPASISEGDSWNQSLTLEGTQTINGTSYPASNQLTSNCTAIAIESVTVEAGTFDALRVECTTDMNLTLAFDPNNPITTPLSLTGINWYAENIGLVKSSTSSPGIESTVELISYNIP